MSQRNKEDTLWVTQSLGLWDTIILIESLTRDVRVSREERIKGKAEKKLNQGTK